MAHGLMLRRFVSRRIPVRRWRRDRAAGPGHLAGNAGRIRWRHAHARDLPAFRAGAAREADTGDIRPTRSVFRNAAQRFLHAGGRRDFLRGRHRPRITWRRRGWTTGARGHGGRVVCTRSRRQALCGRCRAIEGHGSTVGCRTSMNGRARGRRASCRAGAASGRGMSRFSARSHSTGGDSRSAHSNARRSTVASLTSRAADSGRAGSASTGFRWRPCGGHARPRIRLAQPSRRCDGFGRRPCRFAGAGPMHRGRRRCLPHGRRATRAQNRLDLRRPGARRISPGVPALRRRPGCALAGGRIAGRRIAGRRLAARSRCRRAAETRTQPSAVMGARTGTTRSASFDRRPPDSRPRIATLAFGRHRVDRAGDAWRRGVVDAAMAACLVVAPRETARSQSETERAVGPEQKFAPAKADQPRQADDEERERRERRADRAEQMAERRRERVADCIAAAGRAAQRRFERAACQHRADEAEPQPDGARAAQTGAARQHRLDEPPDERNEPDGRPAEPAENYRVHTRHRRMTDWQKRNPSSLNRRSRRLRRRPQVCLRPRAKRAGAPDHPCAVAPRRLFATHSPLMTAL